MIFAFCITTIGLALFLLVKFYDWYSDEQWHTIKPGDKLFQFKRLKPMYLGVASEFGKLFYDGLDGIIWHERGMWHTYKKIKDNEELLHLKGLYTYGEDWVRARKYWFKTDACQMVTDAKHYVDNNTMRVNGKLYYDADFDDTAQLICNIFLWVRNFREDITDKVHDYEP